MDAGMENANISDSPIEASCHCGDIKVTVPRKPDSINECQCTICRRYAAAWAYYNTKEVKFETREGGSTRKYVWGDREIEFHFCNACGCILYWWPIIERITEMGVNTRMMDPDALRTITRKQSFSALFQELKSKNESETP